ncbi:Putative ribonuclease H protein At1g65750 [Linum perenne]
MQTSVLPINTCDEIDRRIRNFVWGSSSEERKIHLVSREHIYDDFNILATASEMVAADESWNLNFICRYLPEEFVEDIAGMSPLKIDIEPHVCTWGLEKMANLQFGRRTISSTSRRIRDRRLIGNWFGGGMDHPEFNISSGQGKILPNLETKRRDLTREGKCPRCEATEESILHVLRDCAFAKQNSRGVKEGLQRAWENGFRKVDARIDSQAILSLIRANNLDEHQHGVDVAALRKLLEGDWEVTITHTYREGNSAADYLADLRHQFPLGVHPISSYDCNLSYFLFATV